LLLQRPEGNEPEILLQQWQELRAVRFHTQKLIKCS
jgi:hypothetical protein